MIGNEKNHYTPAFPFFFFGDMRSFLYKYTNAFFQIPTIPIFMKHTAATNDISDIIAFNIETLSPVYLRTIVISKQHSLTIELFGKIWIVL